MPRTDGYTDLSAVNMDAMRREAARRVDRMERRAMNAVGYGFDGGDNNNDSETHEAKRGDPCRASERNNYYYSAESPADTIFTGYFAAEPSGESRGQDRNVPGAGSPVNNIISILSGERGEQLLLLLLTVLLIREKSDPCLIAALIYLLL